MSLAPASAGPRCATQRASARCVAVFLACLAGAALGCSHGPERAPFVLTDASSVDPEVLELLRQKVDAVRAAPGDAALHGALGLVYSANGLWEGAERSLTNAAELDAANPLWRFYRALALREAGDAAGAKALLVQVARELPSVAGVHQRLGQWCVEEGDLATAKIALERALVLAPDQPDVLIGLANLRIAAEEWQPGLDLAQRALKKDPTLKAARYAAGLALRGLGREKEAAVELASGMGGKLRWIDDPYSAEVRGYRVSYVSQVADATSRMLAGRHAEALPILERVAKKRPNDVDVLGNLAACHQETGNPARAVEILKRALELDPKAFATHLNLADAYLRLQRVEDALPHALKACELAPDLGRAHLMRARALMLRGELEPAYQALRESVKLDANNPTTYVALFEACARLNRVDEARAWCQRSVDLDPTFLPARVNLAHMLIVTGDLAAARVQIDELYRLAPQNERVLAMKRELEARGR
ncbi:MAG: tetratricopeptide repeat protein [Planctomycetes bacterium]|nr:tetratricopeptide repeat protein [Planctomycetota bacterium]